LKNNLLLNKLYIFLILAIISGCGNSDSSETKNDTLLSNIEKNLDQGKGIIVYQMTNNDKSSEQYADWASYLNDFTSSQTFNYVVYESSKELNTQFINEQANVTGSYTLFLKRGKPTYFYDGVIVESMVYMAVDEIYSNGALPPMFQVFLPGVLEINLQ